MAASYRIRFLIATFLSRQIHFQLKYMKNVTFVCLCIHTKHYDYNFRSLISQQLLTCGKNRGSGFPVLSSSPSTHSSFISDHFFSSFMFIMIHHRLEYRTKLKARSHYLFSSLESKEKNSRDISENCSDVFQEDV